MRKTKNITKIYFLLVVFIITYFNTLAQTPDTTNVKTNDIWIEKMNDMIAVDVSINNSFNKFELKKW